VPRAFACTLDLARALSEAGAEVTVVPLLTIQPEVAQPDLLSRLRAADQVVFTSPQAVDVLLGQLEQQGTDVRALTGCRLGVIDETTRTRLRRSRLRVDHEFDAPIHKPLGRVLVVGSVEEIEEVVLRVIAPAQPSDVSSVVDPLPLYSYEVDERFPVPFLDDHDAVVLVGTGAARAFVDTYPGNAVCRQLVVATCESASDEAIMLGIKVDLKAREAGARELVRLIADQLGR